MFSALNMVTLSVQEVTNVFCYIKQNIYHETRKHSKDASAITKIGVCLNIVSEFVALAVVGLHINNICTMLVCCVLLVLSSGLREVHQYSHLWNQTITISSVIYTFT